MGKSSSSSNKIKPSKDSSKLRLVNKKKKKTKRSKSKKKDYSDETSGSDSSFYSSSSDDDYPRRKLRSKKRSRKRYSSSESEDDTDDDDDRLLKKKKRSKRKDERVGTKKKKKKTSSRKRRKRDSSSDSDEGSESDGKRRTRDRVKDRRRRRKDVLDEDSEPADDECWQVEDEVMTENNPRRLKSIVVVSYERYEDMVDDHDDVYLRNGGNGDSGDRELGYNEESDSGGEDYRSESSKALEDDDLEAILKKRALENLQRFRGIASQEASSVVQGEIQQYEPERTQELQDHGLMEQKKLRGFEDSQKILHQVDNVSESGTIASQHSGDTVKVTVSSGLRPCSSKRKLIRPVLGQENSLNLASGKETVGCEDAEAESINGGSIDKDYPESSVALATKNGVENMESTTVSSTLNALSSSHADTETLGESQSEQKTSDETKDESQYEQKTMTVMRGGEMVQVSYKVYIPKKTSALGRRKLQR